MKQFTLQLTLEAADDVKGYQLLGDVDVAVREWVSRTHHGNLIRTGEVLPDWMHHRTGVVEFVEWCRSQGIELPLNKVTKYVAKIGAS